MEVTFKTTMKNPDSLNMCDPKEIINGTDRNTIEQDYSWTNIYNGKKGTISNNQSSSLSKRGKQGGITRNNWNSATTSTANKDFNG